MCARRFLIVIALLTILAVTGAFAIFQFGDRALTSMATPSGHFEAPAPQTGPDYLADASWLAKPGLADDPSRWVPEGVVSTSEAQPAATFFVHPTTYLERDRWNAPLVAGGEAATRATLFVRSQASAFNAVSDVWAPRYRQAAFGAFLLTNEDATKALDLAYGDVLKAFDAFIAAQGATTPIIVAGHSQGSLHLLRLLRDRQDALKGRLVAAYVGGWPVSTAADLPATGLMACTNAAEAGCLLSWQSFGEPANPQLVTGAWVGTTGLTGATRERRDMLCVNPLTGTKDGVAQPSANLGTLLPDSAFSTAGLGVGQVGARCEDGFLLIGGAVPEMGPYVLPGNNYHVYDYALFWGSIRADAARRLAAWRAR